MKQDLKAYKQDLKAYEQLDLQTDVKAPHYVGRFFPSPFFGIEVYADKASFGEDLGSLSELREAIAWFVDQLGGEVKWKEKKITDNKTTKQGVRNEKNN